MMSDERLFTTENIRTNLFEAIVDRYLFALQAETNMNEMMGTDEEAEWSQNMDSMHSEAEGIRVAMVHLGIPLQETFDLKDRAWHTAQERYFR
jgi:hypothetical protein